MKLDKPATQDTAPIPRQSFSTEFFRPHEQFDAWCAFSDGMANLETDGPPSAGFRARSELYQLGSTFLTNYALPPMTIDYGSDVVRRSRLDHWCLALVTRGNVAIDSDRQGFGAKPGDLVLYSYATPFAGKLEAAEYSSLFFSRDDFWDIADELDRASQSLVMGPLSQIIANFLSSVKDRAPELTVTDASAVSEAFEALVRAMVRQTPATLEAARAPIAAIQFDRARRFIAENLTSPELTPDMICARLGLSRRKLFYLFERHGGVATFIRNRRLAACRHALTKSNRPKAVSSVAYDYGFTNPTTFSRQFQARYGFLPSDARSAALSGHRFSDAAGSTFVDWLLRADQD